MCVLNVLFVVSTFNSPPVLITFNLPLVILKLAEEIFKSPVIVSPDLLTFVVSEGCTWSALAIVDKLPTPAVPSILILLAEVSKFLLNAVFLVKAGSAPTSAALSVITPVLLFTDLTASVLSTFVQELPVDINQSPVTISNPAKVELAVAI